MAILLDSTDLEAGEQLYLTTVGIPDGAHVLRWKRYSEKLNWGENFQVLECQNKGALEVTEGV